MYARTPDAGGKELRKALYGGGQAQMEVEFFIVPKAYSLKNIPKRKTDEPV